jgi:hypothetical protein
VGADEINGWLADQAKFQMSLFLWIPHPTGGPDCLALTPSFSRHIRMPQQQRLLKGIFVKQQARWKLATTVEMVTSRRLTLRPSFAVLARHRSAIGGDEMCSRTRIADAQQIVCCYPSSGRDSLDVL